MDGVDEEKKLGREGRSQRGREDEGGREGRRKGRKEEARQGGGTKRGSALRTKLKSRGCNSRRLKTILH